MAEFFGNIEELTLKNENYLKILGTTSNMQLVIMSLAPSEETEEKEYADNSLYIKVVSGKCLVLVGSERKKLYKHDSIIIPPNNNHNITNLSKKPLKIYIIYSLPEYKPACIQHGKYDACD